MRGQLSVLEGGVHGVRAGDVEVGLVPDSPLLCLLDDTVGVPLAESQPHADAALPWGVLSAAIPG